MILLHDLIVAMELDDNRFHNLGKSSAIMGSIYTMKKCHACCENEFFVIVIGGIVLHKFA